MKFRAAIILLAIMVSLPAWAQTIQSSSASTPHPGIRLVEGRTSGPTTDFWAAYVSLCNDSVHVDASAYDGYSTSGGWASSVGAELAVNGDFFIGTPRLHVYGDAVASGSRWPLNRMGLHSDYSGDWYYERYGWIAFGEDWVDFTNSEFVKNNFDRFNSLEGWKPREVAPDPPPGTKALLSGFPQLVIDGAPITCSSPTASSCFPDRTDMRTRNPRTAMGLSRDRQTFILVVVDGRSTRSAGMYGAELAKLMGDLGAWTAFNLDGGGSSQMWVRGQGTVNRPSGGSPRSVVNHWGIFAGSGNGLPSLPGHCDNDWDGLIHVLQGQVARTTDVDGDGRGDVCTRTSTGVKCSLFSDGEFGPAFDGPELADSSGWADPSNYATMRWGDIDGDGRADLCARANAGIRCWKSIGTGFGETITGPALADDDGFDRAAYFSTIRLLDFNGDGRDDICARWSDGVKCYASTGDGFAEAIDGPALSDDSGWGDVSNYGTLRTGDVNGDGMDDICARANQQVYCWLSDGTGFSQRVDGPQWSDDDGWNKNRQWSTIRLIDLDDDGRADLCGRAKTGLVCHLSEGDSFGAEITGPALSDDSGWADYSNYSTLRFADVTGDRLLDACARANGGYRCWPFQGDGFGAAIDGPLQDESGWTREHYHRTADFVDLDADGKADLCARASAGIVCWRSTGTAFEEMLIEGPAWSDEAGFDDERYYGTTRFLGPVRAAPEEPSTGDMGAGGDDTGTGSGSDAGVTLDPPGDGGSDGADTATPDPYGGSDGGLILVDGQGGCGCSATSSPKPVAWGVLLVLFSFAQIKRRRAHRATA